MYIIFNDELHSTYIVLYSTVIALFLNFFKNIMHTY